MRFIEQNHQAIFVSSARGDTNASPCPHLATLSIHGTSLGNHKCVPRNHRYSKELGQSDSMNYSKLVLVSGLRTCLHSQVKFFQSSNVAECFRPVSSKLCEQLLFVSDFVSQSKEIKFGFYFFDVCCINY